MKTAEKTTRVVAGHQITLQPGCRYLASRPMIGSRRQTICSVSFRVKDAAGFDIIAEPVFEIHGLSYDAANELLAAFNNEETSFTGRVWA